ncbi:hypothetical protein [Salana multivorans]
MNTMTASPADRPVRHGDELSARAARARRWTTAGAFLAGAGSLAALVAGLTGNGATSSLANPALSLTYSVPPERVALALGIAAALVCGGLVVLGALARAVGRGSAPAGLTPARVALAVVVPLLAILALAATCDANPLALAGYLPAVLVGSLFSAELREGLAAVPWPQLLAQLAVIGTTIVTVVAALHVLDTLRGDMPRPRWQQPPSAARWGRVAVVVAVVVPLLYATTRIAWVLGWPIGFDAEAYAATGGDVRTGLVLAAGALVGCVLTIGLVRPWGERFWRWLPVLGGRPVPVALAVVPASIVAAMLLPAGISMTVAAAEQLGVASIGSLSDNWAAIGVTFLWPLWSVALAAATFAYALRRRAA